MIAKTFEQLKAWDTPREAFHSGQRIPFLLVCQLSGRPASEIEVALVNGGDDIRAFWRLASDAELFKDEHYGQWGLKIFSPSDVMKKTARERRERPEDVYESDLVIGEFIGDSDQLMIDTSRSCEGFYPVLVKLPIDGREEWPIVAESFGEFLRKYTSKQGQKYWE
jgi:hypothetical protein